MTPTCESSYPPPARLRNLGVVIAVVGVGAVVPLILDRPGIVLGTVVIAFGLLLVAVGLQLAFTPVRATVTPEAVHVLYPPFRRTIAAGDISEVLVGDQVNGFGFGYGVRLEGRGRWAYRLGTPMVTIVHREGRVGISVEDADAFAMAARRARRGH